MVVSRLLRRPARSTDAAARRRPRRDRGAALLSVLLLVTVMTTIAVEITDDIRFAWRRLIATQAREQAQWYALGAESFVREVIRRSWEVDPERSTLEAPWAQGPTVFPIDGGTLEGVVRDANNCFNLNSVVRPGPRGGYETDPDRLALYRALLTVLELEQADPDTLAGGLADWIDADGEVTGRGAEDVEYSLMTPPSRPANALLEDVLELRGIAGYTEVVVQRLRPFVCAYPDIEPSRLNFNTLLVAHAPLMSVFLNGALSPSQAATLLEGRPVGGYDTDAGFWADVDSFNQLESDTRQEVEARFGPQTLYYDATARVLYNDFYLELNSMLKLDPQSGAVTVLNRRFGERNG